MAVSYSTPEPLSDLQAQVSAMLNTNHLKDAVFIATGNGIEVDNRCPDVHVVSAAAGTLLTTNAAKARMFADPLLDDAGMAQILGYPCTKLSAVQSANPIVLQARDAAGNIVHEAGVDGSSEAHRAHMQRYVPDGGELVSISPDAVRARRSATILLRQMSHVLTVMDGR